MKKPIRILISLAMTAGLTAGLATGADAATVVGSNKASCNPRNAQGSIDYNVRIDQTLYRTSGPTGKILAYTATPNKDIVRAYLPDIHYKFRFVEVNGSRSTRNPGQFGSTGTPYPNVYTETIPVWDVYVGSQYLETLRCVVASAKF